MFSLRSRPILYFTLPGVAFIMGVIWLRRRNKVRCGDMGKDENTEDVPSSNTNNNLKQTNGSCKTSSNTLNINGTIGNKNLLNTNSSSDNNSSNSIPTILGKSAPINIVPNGKHSSTDQQKKIEIDKQNKTQDQEEQFDEYGSCDLPGSLNEESFNMKHVYATDKNQVVVKATTSPKISPENSFVERPLEETTTTTNSNAPKSEEARKNEVTSPSLSMCSVQSSTDSGKGSSLPRSSSDDKNNVKNSTSSVQKPQFSTYEFFLPTSLIGRLYGNRRNFLNKIKAKTSVKIQMKKHPYTEKINVCVIEGSENDINAALKMIRSKLPSKQYPNLTMQRIHFAMPQTIVPLTSEHSMGLTVSLIRNNIEKWIWTLVVIRWFYKCQHL